MFFSRRVPSRGEARSGVIRSCTRLCRETFARLWYGFDVQPNPKYDGNQESATVSRPSLHSERRNLTRQRLIEASVEKFSELGYHSTRIEDIVDAAGASRSTFYLHFNSKVDIVHELLAIVEPEAIKIFARLGEMESVSRESLYGTIAEFVDFYARHRMAMRAIEDAIAIDHDVEAVYQPAVQRLAEGLARHLGSGQEGKHNDAQLRATLLIVQLERFCFMWIVRGGWDLDHDQTISSITDIWWREIRAQDTR